VKLAVLGVACTAAVGLGANYLWIDYGADHGPLDMFKTEGHFAMSGGTLDSDGDFKVSGGAELSGGRIEVAPGKWAEFRFPQ